MFDLARGQVAAVIASTNYIMWLTLDRTLIGAPVQIISAYSMTGLI